ncbi:MAG TPA: hypothetical protein VLE51_01710 [Candidatus Saccharimonadales bacterium]|nr:hypothetical protein [Candidatus Saccharimonadales bacterium]
MDPEFYTYDENGDVIRNPDYITEWVYHPDAIVLGSAGVLRELREDVDREIEVALGEKDYTAFQGDH